MEAGNGISLPRARFVAALRRIRSQIANGSKLELYDCDNIGDKDTSCTWGLCSNHREQWPDAEDHLWPDEFSEDGRVAPLYRDDGQNCPFDTGAETGEHPSGCFYRCMMFQRTERRRPTREQALNIYDAKLESI